MKVKQAHFSVALLKIFLAPGNVIPAARVTADGWPEDARIISASVEARTSGSVVLIVESDTFEEVEDIRQAPYLNTQFETINV